MSVGLGDLGKTVIVKWGPGEIKAVGKMVGFLPEPSATIRLPDGKRLTWAASLCEVEAPAVEPKVQNLE